MNRFEKLKLWQRAVVIAENCYHLSNLFPKDEKYNLISQIRRAAVSIPSNIAEGAGRNTPGEFKQFLGIANGSSFELITQLKLSYSLNLIPEEKTQPIIKDLLEVCNMNYALQKTLLKK